MHAASPHTEELLFKNKLSRIARDAIPNSEQKLLLLTEMSTF